VTGGRGRRSIERRLNELDRPVTRKLGLIGPLVTRLGLGAIFLWFGALKFVPRLSPADELAGPTVERLTAGALDAKQGVLLAAVMECLIGLGLLSNRFVRATLLLLGVQMLGTLSPLVLFPERTFRHPPIVPTLEGQYILKNVVLVGAAMVVGSRVRDGRVR
jgi:uncharacterized membrane protein YkgB